MELTRIRLLSSYLYHSFISAWIGNLLGAVLLIVPFFVSRYLSERPFAILESNTLARFRS